MLTDPWHSLRKRLPFAPSLILVLGVIAGGFAVFWSLAEEILEGESHAFDQWILLALRRVTGLE